MVKRAAGRMQKATPLRKSSGVNFFIGGWFDVYEND